ncbi:MAG TPA: hypothetical protein VM223_03835 [Planctomycetota bacterium]|nr:hypothetical protein [Planctomycetota bacterium]
MKLRGTKIALAILALLALCACNGIDRRAIPTGTGELCGSSQQIVEQPGIVDGWYRVHRVIDGDTIILANVGRLRLADVNAPELDTPAGIAARDELAARIEGRAVQIRFTRRKRASGSGPAGSVITDRYGRLVGSLIDLSGTATLEK